MSTPGTAEADVRLLLGGSPPMRELAEQIAITGRDDRTALLVGERGVGKSRVARAIHALSERAARPFVEMHCGDRTAVDVA